MSQTRKVTLAWLAERGIVGDKWPDDYDHECIEDTDCSRGLATVVFKDDGKFWRLEIEYHPEDWPGTNDLVQYRPEHTMELTQVAPVQRTVWEAVP